MHVTTKNKKVFVMPNMDFTTFDAEDIIVASEGVITHSLYNEGRDCTCGAIWISDGTNSYWGRDNYGYHK